MYNKQLILERLCKSTLHLFKWSLVTFFPFSVEFCFPVFICIPYFMIIKSTGNSLKTGATPLLYYIKRLIKLNLQKQ